MIFESCLHIRLLKKIKLINQSSLYFKLINKTNLFEMTFVFVIHAE